MDLPCFSLRTPIAPCNLTAIVQTVEKVRTQRTCIFAAVTQITCSVGSLKGDTMCVQLIKGCKYISGRFFRDVLQDLFEDQLRLLSKQLVKLTSPILAGKLRANMFIDYSFQNPVRHDNSSNWLTLSYLARPWTKESPRPNSYSGRSPLSYKIRQCQLF